MTATANAPIQGPIYLGKTVPKSMSDKIRFEPSRPREMTLAAVLIGLVFLTRRMPSKVSKYLSPSNGNMGSILIRATLIRISCSQKKA